MIEDFEINSVKLLEKVPSKFGTSSELYWLRAHQFSCTTDINELFLFFSTVDAVESYTLPCTIISIYMHFVRYVSVLG